MGRVELDSKAKRQADFRLCNVSSHLTELLEIRADDPKMHVLLIPGNPGVVPFYKDFVESLYEFLEGNASITAISHLSHTKKITFTFHPLALLLVGNASDDQYVHFDHFHSFICSDWDHGRLFSLEEQTDHKMDFIKQELENIEVPIILVGHSIGSYISIDMFRRYSEKVIYCIGLYPFLALNLQSTEQSIIGKIAASRVVSVALSLMVASLGFLPRSALRLIVTNSLAKSWSAVAVEATCSHLVQYHTMRNVLFMAMTEFRKLTATPDWAFMREKKEKLAFLFGGDDHWGPLQMFEEISKQVPGIALSIERGHKHAFSCTEAGASCVAKYVASLIKNQLLHSRQ
ncbi:hypothetical protein ACB092_09G069700 [Castanea dentata]